MYLFCSSHHVWQFCCLHVSSHLESTHVQNAVKLLLWQGADIRNISYRNSVWWPNYIIKSVDKTKLSHITPPPQQHHSFSKSLPPLFMSKILHPPHATHPLGDSTFLLLVIELIVVLWSSWTFEWPWFFWRKVEWFFKRCKGEYLRNNEPFPTN